MGKICTPSINVTATAVITGGTQLVEGEHLTGGEMLFCSKSSKSCVFFLLIFSNLPNESF